MFLAEETKPDYRYCRLEVHVPGRGNQVRLQVLWTGSTCSLQRKPSQITGIVDRKYMFLAEETMPDYMYCRPEVMFLVYREQSQITDTCKPKPSQITGIVERKYLFLAEEAKPDYRYCRPEVHVPCRGNQARLQVL